MREDVLEIPRASFHLSEPVPNPGPGPGGTLSRRCDGPDNASWSVVRLPDAEAAAYRLALRQAEAACRNSPEYGVFLTLWGSPVPRGPVPEAAATLTHAP